MRELASGDWQLGAGYGAAKGLAHLGTQAARGLTHYFPSLGDLAAKYPALQSVAEFGEEPTETIPEKAGSFIGENLPFMFFPAGRGYGAYSALGRALDRAYPRMAPAFRRGVGWVTKKVPRVSRQEIAKATKAEAGATKGRIAAQAAGGGAVAGAAGDPEDPARGAVTGGAIGPISAGFGSFLAGPRGQRLMRYFGPEAAVTAYLEMTGNRFYPFGPLLLGRHFAWPGGGPLGDVSAMAARAGGRFLAGGAPAAAHGGAQLGGAMDMNLMDIARQAYEMYGGDNAQAEQPGPR
jgi:hypothetical protein